MTTDISVVRWDPSQGPGSEYIDEYEYDGGNSSSRLFERSRIKALAGKSKWHTHKYAYIYILFYCYVIKSVEYILIYHVFFFSSSNSFSIVAIVQRNVRQYKRKHSQNGWIRIWCVWMHASAICTLTCATVNIWSNYWKCYLVNVFRNRQKAKCVYIAWKM